MFDAPCRYGTRLYDETKNQQSQDDTVWCSKRNGEPCVGEDSSKCPLIIDRVGVCCTDLPTDEKVRSRMDNFEALAALCDDVNEPYDDIVTAYLRGIKLVLTGLNNDPIFIRDFDKMLDAYAYWVECRGVYKGLAGIEEGECVNS